MTGRRDPGDGGIDARGPNRWRLRYRVGGKRYTMAFHGTITEAKRELRRLLKSVDDGVHVAPDKLLLSAWVGRWIALQERLINARTLERYESLLRVHVLPVLGSRPLQQITASEIDALYMTLEIRLAPGTLHFLHVVLSSCLGAAVRKGLIRSNPATRAEAPTAGDSNAGQVLDQDQLAALLAGFRGRALYPIVAVAAFTGARRNEILALRWSDVNFNDKTLTIARALEQTKAHGARFKEPKTSRGRRTFAIDDGLVALLTAEREQHLRIMAGVGDGVDVDLSLVKLPDDALVFPAPGGDIDFTRPRAGSAITGRFADYARKLGFAKLRFHDLRGTHETLLLDAGVPVHVVAARCGHDPAILLRNYARMTKKADVNAAAVIGALSKSWVQVGSKPA